MAKRRRELGSGLRQKNGATALQRPYGFETYVLWVACGASNFKRRKIFSRRKKRRRLDDRECRKQRPFPGGVRRCPICACLCHRTNLASIFGFVRRRATKKLSGRRHSSRKNLYDLCLYASCSNRKNQKSKNKKSKRRRTARLGNCTGGFKF